MLPLKYRLNVRKEFTRIKENGKKIFLTDIIVYTTNNINTQKPKIAITVSKKNVKKATIRNRIRRIISAQLEKNINQINKNSETIIIVVRDISKKTQNEIQVIVKNVIDFINNEYK